MPWARTHFHEFLSFPPNPIGGPMLQSMQVLRFVGPGPWGFWDELLLFGSGFWAHSPVGRVGLGEAVIYVVGPTAWQLVGCQFVPHLPWNWKIRVTPPHRVNTWIVTPRPRSVFACFGSEVLTPIRHGGFRDPIPKLALYIVIGGTRLSCSFS